MRRSNAWRKASCRDGRCSALHQNLFRQPSDAGAAVTPRVHVRSARPEGAEAVAAVLNAINSMDGPPPPVWMTGEIVRRDLLSDAPRAALLVAELDGRVVGFAAGNAVYDSMRAADAFFLNDLYMALEARRLGAGRALVSRLAALAKERGARCLRWGVDLGGGEALRFYDALGAADEGQCFSRILIGPVFEALATGGQEKG